MRGYIDNIRVIKEISRYPYNKPINRTFLCVLLVAALAMIFLFVSFPKTILALYSLFLFAMYYLIKKTPHDSQI